MQFEDIIKIEYNNRPVYKAENIDELEKESEIFRFYRDSRKNMQDNPYRPVFHYSRPVEGCKLNDPNGLCYYNGKWHLFYQAINVLNGERSIHWGHIVSDDLVHWVDLPDAHYPDYPEKECWSGSVCIKDGKAYSMHFGNNKSWDYGLVCSYSEDPLLLNWTRFTPGKPSVRTETDDENPDYRVYDPFIWEEDGVFYVLSGRFDRIDNTKYRRQIYLFSSENGEAWEYMHPFIKEDYDGSVSDDAGCPYFFKIKDDKYLLLHFCHHMVTSKYAIGTYNKEKKEFSITSGGFLAQTKGLHAPAMWPVGENEFCTVFNANGIKSTFMSLPRILSEHDGDIYVKPIEQLRSLRYDNVHKNNVALKKGKELLLDGMYGREFELNVEFEKDSDSMMEIKLFCSDDGSEYTSIFLIPNGGRFNMDVTMKKHLGTNSVFMGETLHSSRENRIRCAADRTELLINDGETVNIRIYADRSVIEAFINDKKSIILHVAPDVTSDKIKLVAHGKDMLVNTVDFWRMKGIF